MAAVIRLVQTTVGPASDRKRAAVTVTSTTRARPKHRRAFITCPPARVSALGAGLDDTDRAADAGAAQPAVAVRHLVQVLLVVVLGVVERSGLAGGPRIRRDLSEAELVEQGLVRGARRLVGLLLLVGRPVHRRAVLGADV